MGNIEKKALKLTSDLLKSFDSYEVYSSINKALIKSSLSAEEQKLILKAYQEPLNEQFKKVTVAKEWIDAIISDLE